MSIFSSAMCFLQRAALAARTRVTGAAEGTDRQPQSAASGQSDKDIYEGELSHVLGERGERREERGERNV